MLAPGRVNSYSRTSWAELLDRDRPEVVRRIGTSVLAVLLVAALVITGLAVFQRRLIYLTGAEPVPPVTEVLPGGTEWILRTEDGLELAAWFVAAPSPRSTPATVVVAPGNAGNRSHRAPLAGALTGAGFDVLLVDYRGYGGNPGSPTESGLALDIRAAYEAVLTSGVPAGRILLFGESLGSAVVTALAAEVPAAGLVLRSPFVDLASVAADAYPFLPVRWLLQDKLPVLERIRDVEIPVAVVYGTADSIVDPAQSRRVAGAAPNTVATIPVEGADHNDAELGHGPQVVAAVRAVADA